MDINSAAVREILLIAY